jgi:hypothetical protein
MSLCLAVYPGTIEIFSNPEKSSETTSKEKPLQLLVFGTLRSVSMNPIHLIFEMISILSMTLCQQMWMCRNTG